MAFFRPTSLTIHLDRLAQNYRVLSSFGPGFDFVCPMIKANAYGHGDVAVGKTLIRAGCQQMGVSSVEEGVHLREHHITENILVFGFQGKAAVQALLEHQLTPVVSDFDQLSELCQQIQQATPIHLKIDSGMHRLGFQSHEIEGLLQVLAKNPLLVIAGLGTHLHSGASVVKEQGSAWQQVQEFEKISSLFKQSAPIQHVYNSAAIAALHKNKQPYRYGFRPGLLVYGIDPGENLQLKPLVSPVMEFKSKIVSLQEVKSGDVVSYGGTWTAPQDSVIGIVPAGYGDGVCRSLSNKGEFLVQGKRVPVRGRVCMDYTMVDLTLVQQNPRLLIGSEVVIIGRQGTDEVTVEELAEKAGRVTYEVMTGISERVPRDYGVCSG